MPLASYGLGPYISVGIGQEATYNATWGTPTLGLMVKPFGLSELGPEMIETEHATGHLMTKDTEIDEGLKNWGATLEGAVPQDAPAFGFLLAAIFDELGSSKYTIGTSDTTSVRMCYLDHTESTTTNSWRLCGGKPKSLKITATPGQYVTFAADMTGTNPQRNNADGISLTYATSGKYYAYNDVSVEIAGSPLPFTSCEITIDAGLCDSPEDSNVLGSQSRVRLVPGVRKVTGTLNRVLESTYGSAAWATQIGSTTDICMKCTGASGTIKMWIDMPMARITKWSQENVGNTGLTHETWEFQAFWHGTDPDADFYMTYFTS